MACASWRCRRRATKPRFTSGKPRCSSSAQRKRTVADLLTIAYRDERARADAEQLGVDLATAGVSGGRRPVLEIPPLEGKMGVGEIVLTIVVLHVAKAAIGMVFDDLEKVLLKFMKERRSKAS